MPTTKTPALPTSDELELADYKLGSFASDLDWIKSMLERCSRDDITPEEYLRLRDEGGELPPAPEYDRDELARIVVFATDVLSDLDAIRKDAEAIQAEALDLYHEPGSMKPDPEAYAQYQARVRQWHEAALKGRDDA